MPTKVLTRNGRQLVIRLGDGATPTEVFTQYCIINTERGIEFGSSPVETLAPWCPPDELKPGWMERDIDGLTATITGAGIFDAKSHKPFFVWYESGLAKNIQVEIINTTLANGGGMWSGAARLSTFNITGATARDKLTFSCTILSDGEWVWTDALA